MQIACFFIDDDKGVLFFFRIPSNPSPSLYQTICSGEFQRLSAVVSDHDPARNVYRFDPFSFFFFVQFSSISHETNSIDGFIFFTSVQSISLIVDIRHYVSRILLMEIVDVLVGLKIQSLTDRFLIRNNQNLFSIVRFFLELFQTTVFNGFL